MEELHSAEGIPVSSTGTQEQKKKEEKWELFIEVGGVI